MTVKELIETLQKFDPNKKVASEEGWEIVGAVEVNGDSGDGYEGHISLTDGPWLG